MTASAPTPTHHSRLAPIEVLPEHFRDDDSKRAYTSEIFDQTAPDYDRVETWLSLGSGRWYRRRALARAGVKPGLRMLDVAMGTGLVAREAKGLLMLGTPQGAGGSLTGLDPSGPMMAQNAAELSIPTVIGRAEALPFGAGSFDFLSMGYALRHIADLRPALAEFHRVLAPGGRVCILEITRPTTWMGRAFMAVVFRTLTTLMRIRGVRSKRTPELWDYYWKTIQACVTPEQLMQAMREAGFVRVERHVELGVFSSFTATRE
jgi:demethylmenaquinone methyltransferase/2-methoxy-6-polyprenyl-1,4-benzoquinol methylase